MRFLLFWFFIAVSALLSLRNPFFGCIIYSCINILRPELFFWGSSQHAANSMPIIIGATFLGCLFNSNKIVVKNLITKEFFLLCLLYLGVISSVYFGDYSVPRQYEYANEFGKIAILCAFMLITMTSAEKIYRYEKWILICVVFLALWGVDQHFRGNVRLEKLGGFDSNGIAAFFALFFPLCFSQLLLAKNSKKRALFFVPTGLLTVAILFTKSRGGLLGLLVGVILTIFRSKKRSKILIYVAMVTCLLMPLISQQYSDRFQEVDTSQGEMDWSAESRLYLWKLGLMIFYDNPFLGTGFLTYPVAKFEYQNQFNSLPQQFHNSIFRSTSPKVTHNTYIKFLADTGLAGFVPYMLLILGTIYSNHQIRKRARFLRSDKCNKMSGLLTAIENGIIAICVCNMFIDGNTGVMQYVQITVCSIIRTNMNIEIDNIDNNSSANQGS
ncbi:O-antigen ligase [Desulforhopalus sp. IMCC35007]|uniref:O-antigen ligase family protein n=1 Tax=Desulforhopalus sp. IMCC35007 TaxID=2569543 RepID=UPI0010AEBCF7|nr:O-antigen ligase family protein [Desulforhopalus sp. IMCC35007]TKB07410.1 hypothetical protein FCL48_16840 [Desulforhopalus sp. IMCC35007]